MWRAAGVLLLGLLLAQVGARAANRSALWKIVHGECVPHEQAVHDPSPCSSVDLARGVARGFAVLKDIKGVAQFLLIPTARIGGIEDPAILAPDATNYWDAAWQARYFVDERVHNALPRDAIAFVVNSSLARSQDQLHIHIDCILPDVRAALAVNLDKVEAVWTPFPIPLAGHRYRSIRINQERLDEVNPFRVLADSDPLAGGDMGMHTLVLVGETFANGSTGFVLLDDHINLATGDDASGEQLQDHT
ncbi:MAG: CDP-diacylglycerol diphosphatase, partial [Pseudomonadota bacterium]|nr:CDP-diacylglycerol diphosphatase [Pseudomonadota bacterium]